MPGEFISTAGACQLITHHFNAVPKPAVRKGVSAELKDLEC